jgi:hypothetical protein
MTSEGAGGVETDTDFAVRTYNNIGLHLGPWLWQSKGHHTAAKVQWEASKRPGIARGIGVFHSAIALMLAGFAVETLLKMVLIGAHFRTAKFPASYTKLKQCIPPIHDLRKLAESSRVRINESDRRVLDDLTTFVVWAGRYPLPKTAVKYDGPSWLATLSNDSTDRDDKLWTRYAALWPKLLKQADVRLRD